MPLKFCPYCLPTKTHGHFFNKIEYCVKKFFIFEFAGVRINQKLVIAFLKVLKFLKIAKFELQPDREKIKNRSYIFFEEAEKRNLNIRAVKVLNNYIGDYLFTYNGREYRYEGTPLSLFDKKKIDIDDKARVKRLLARFGLPVTTGRNFWLKLKAFSYGCKVGFPLVVKPNSGSLSRHVTVGVDAKEKLKEAIIVAQKYQPEIIVEKFLAGNLYRATVINQKIIYICQKILASIIGDGVSSVAELIAQKNKNEKRGPVNNTLPQIETDETFLSLLEKNELTLNSILEKERKIMIGEKYTLADACEIINVKNSAHHKNIEMFLKAARVLGQPLIGFDFICPDIAVSFDKQVCGIIEANSLPYLDMHQFPTSGEPESVATEVWDCVLKALVESR